MLEWVSLMCVKFVIRKISYGDIDSLNLFHVMNLYSY